MSQLRKTHQTPEFPPKRVIHNTVKVLELRRAALEAYLQTLLLIEPTPRPLLDFLGVQPQPSLIEVECQEVSHQPLLAFRPNIHLEGGAGRTGDIVTEGVLTGLYGR
ncbi:sorting nexin-24-like isoform X2 [Pollicipes pollicipes]|uniref:sorting nexin-24-like isoform X2 n=1 Tax=Pollicipes pollicipes TaxID=41117 RepID=UPI001884A69C|nr:sorting nexin-24-like isoform X2 [Pollicipes pollicipes]